MTFSSVGGEIWGIGASVDSVSGCAGSATAVSGGDEAADIAGSVFIGADSPGVAATG